MLECERIATELYQRHSAEIINDNILGLNSSLTKGIEGGKLEKFWGHGITRGSGVDQISAAISILNNQAMIGDSAQLKSGHLSAFAHGGFLVVSKAHELLMEFTHARKPIFVSLGENHNTKREIKGVKIKVGAIVVANKFKSLVPELRNMFPDQEILYEGELMDYIDKQLSEE